MPESSSESPSISPSASPSISPSASPSISPDGTLVWIRSNSTHGSQVFTDSSTDGAESPHTVTVGNATFHSSDQTRGGNSTSIYMSGRSSPPQNGTDDDLYFSADSPDFDLGSGDFTVDFYMYPLDNITSGLVSYASPTIAWTIRRDDAVGTHGHIYFLGSKTPGFYDLVSIYSDEVVPLNQWTHIAVVRNNGNVMILLDLVESPVNNGQYASNVVGSFAAGYYLVVGAEATLSPPYYKGYMDEVRISNFARWTRGYSPLVPKVGDDWRTKNLLYVNAGGEWRTPSKVHVKSGGDWKQVFSKTREYY